MFMGDAMIISHKTAVADNTRRTANAAGRSANVNAVTRPRTQRRWLSAILLFVPLFLTSCGDSASLATVSTEGEGIEILNILHENGISAHKEEVGEEGVKQWKIVLDQRWFGGTEEVAMANQVLQDNGLPRPTYSGSTPASDGGMFKDEATRKAEQLKERETDLQRKLRLLPGVIGIEVTIVEPEDSSININPYPSTAAVLIVTKDDPPNFDQATIRGLVARSVPKLNADSVFVTITTKPVRPLAWRALGAQRQHKILDAVGIGIMTILASSIVVLMLQLRRQNNELAALRDSQKTEPRQLDEGLSKPDLELTAANIGNEHGTSETTALARPANTTGVVPTAS
jgi:type III secretory pathway lipoprotein EscJ